MDSPSQTPELPRDPVAEARALIARRELARRHLMPYIQYVKPSYAPSWHHRLIAEKLEAVERGEVKRLMLFLPPRHGKSELASVQFPAWYLGRNPHREIIATSYAGDLAVTFGRQVRNTVATPDYHHIFQIELSEDSKAANKWNTSVGGSYIAVGVGGPITGRGADVLIIDDPFKNRKEADSPVVRNDVWNWYTSTAYTRLSPEGAVVLIMTRWHDDDLAGRLLADPEGDHWEVVELPAIATKDEVIDGQLRRGLGQALWPERWPLEKLEARRQVLGAFEFSALYQQNPIDEASQEFRKEWFKVRPLEEVEKLNTRRFLTVDTAGQATLTSDYTGIVDNRVDVEGNWNVEAYKYKLSTAQLVELLFALQQKHHYEKIGIEKTIYLDALKAFLDTEMMKRGMVLPIVELKHGGRSKPLRIRGLLPRYQYGRIYHVQGRCDELIPQLLRFPKGAEDDILDALAYQDQVAEAPFGWAEEDFRGDGGARAQAFDRHNPFGEI